MMYSNVLLDYFYRMEHAGLLLSEPHLLVYSEAIGDVGQAYLCRLYLGYWDGVILKAKFQAYASVPVMAACECLCCVVEGKSVLEVSTLTVSSLQDRLDLSKVQKDVSVLVIRLLQKTIASVHHAIACPSIQVIKNPLD